MCINKGNVFGRFTIWIWGFLKGSQYKGDGVSRIIMIMEALGSVKQEGDVRLLDTLR